MKNGKIRLLYDGTLLAEGLGKGSNRSGIFFVVYNVFRELLKFDDLEIVLYCDPTRMDELQGFIWQYLNGYRRKIEIINDPQYMRAGLMVLDRAVLNVRDIKNNLCANHRCLRCQLMRGVLLALKVLRKAERTLTGRVSVLSQDWRERLSSVDAVLSPAFPHMPEVIAAGVKRYTILYDAIPYIFPDLFPDTKYGCSWNLNLLKSLNADDVCFSISKQTKEDFLSFSALFREKGNDLLAMYEERDGINSYTRHIVKALRERREQGLLPVQAPTEHDSSLRRENVEVMLLAASENFYECKSVEKILEVRRKYGIPEGKKYVFSLCTLESRKNILYAIRGFLHFAETEHAEEMIFVLGGGSWAKYAEALEKALGDIPGWQEKILRIGYVDDADLAPLFTGAFCTVYPSLYEGFGLPPLEAMQCGCPVITSDNSSLPEVVGDAGIMIDINQPGSLEAALKRLYDNPRERKEFKQRGLERAKAFSWRKAAEVVHDRICRDFGKDRQP